MRQYFVYIVGSPSRTIYTGVTSNLERRMWEHKHKVYRGFTAKYGVDRLVYMEEYAWIDDAIAREREIKAWRREKKLALIEAENPGWRDLSHGWYDDDGLVTDRPASRAGDSSVGPNGPRSE